MTPPTEYYPSKPLSSIKERPIGQAKFKEPIFKLGVFQNSYIEVEVKIYPISISDPKTNKPLVGVRFGQMNVIRFVDRDLLYNIEALKS